MQTTNKSAELFERSKKVSPGGVHSPVRAFRGVGGVPRFMQSAKGCRMTDVDGNQYVDFCMSWGPLLFGHQDEEVKSSVDEALSRGWSFGTAEPYSLELAELITSQLPWVQSIRFVNSGTEAVMSALRVARAATGRRKILKFDGCYHGHADSLLVRAGSGLAEMSSPDSAGVSKEVASETIVAPLNNLEAYKTAIDQHKSELAAVILEPIPANNGLLLQTDEFLKTVTEYARKNGVLVIYDEVITGFRVAFGGMAEVVTTKFGQQAQPDLVTYGKVIGGGFPVGAYGGRRDLMELVAPAGPVYQAGTLSANPIAMCAGLVMLKKIQKTRPYSKLEKTNDSLTSELRGIIKKVGMQMHVQSVSSLFWMISGEIKTADGFVRSHNDIPSSQKESYAKLFHKLLENGCYLAPSGYEVSFLSTAHRDQDIGYFLESFEKSLKD